MTQLPGFGRCCYPRGMVEAALVVSWLVVLWFLDGRAWARVRAEDLEGAAQVSGLSLRFSARCFREACALRRRWLL